MHELRILNGYHRGAAFPLDGQPCVVGADDEADVVIVDPGIARRHASIALSPSGWTLERMDGVLRNAEDNLARDVLHLGLDEFARVDHIWLTVTAQGSPWREPPPEPREAPVAPAQMAAEPPQAPAAGEEYAAQGAEPGPAAQMAGARAAPARTARKRRLIAVPLALATLFSAAAAYAITRHYPADEDGQQPGANAAPAALAAEAASKKLSPEELRAAFRKRLAEIDLLRRFNLQLEDQYWTMQAALDEDDAERFQRMLDKFVRAHGIHFPVKVKIGNAESMLPFKVQQVISGSNASIVTDDGRRMYVGDEYRGVTLAAIEGSQVSFTGKHNIQLRW